MDNSSFSWERFNKSNANTTPTNNNTPVHHLNELLNVNCNDDLFVFGYSCKLYQEDDKTRWINSGQHMIPWMGQQDLLIDRYDARGYLNDLSQYDSKHLAKCNLTNNELELENALNAERYADLKYDEEDSDTELSSVDKTSSRYAQVGYQYNEDKCDKSVDEIKQFQIPHGLKVPPGMALPDNNKLHCIIEKTALFVAQNGPQMEILLKTKQAGNSNFNFLSIDFDLNPYYKLILSEIKSGRYVPKEDNDKLESGSESDDEYLHPSLLSSKPAKSQEQFNIPNVFTAKQENDSYSQLVKYFKDNFADDIVEDKKVLPEKEDLKTNKNFNVDMSSLIPTPSKDIEVIITKLAQHVSKNGESFEHSIKALNDKKFDFLNPGHIFHPYYVKQKIRYISEVNRKQIGKFKDKGKPNSIDNDSKNKLITFSIAPKEVPKKIQPINTEELGKNNLTKPESVILSKEKLLQEERKKKAMHFLENLRKENKLDECHTAVYGPNLPIQNRNIELSPTIEAITSPLHSYDFEDDDSLVDYSKSTNKIKFKPNQSLLPFISSDSKIKGQSLSSKRRNFSPPRRYRISSKDDDSSYKETSSRYKKLDEKKSKKHHRSRSKRRSRSRSSHRSHRYHHSRRSISQSRSPSPSFHRNSKHRSKE